ncbi:DUF3679 domain-containing protein [Neobacillus sp. PS3-34]|uniref:DUF3679 domain-containing protein n=1 Tax=Neobacillus sp. PS3-34 TaxID=3070678 RepID=UPI0027E1968F|nr:DUF3679 domain-containing protein [Neobacillus sp. PS3-34]WML47462.1 DUF3679 domain-containing protein [Neobacillus sp. PS3-34]
MKIFMLKSTLIAVLMFISVLAGMQMASGGIHKMKGYHDPEFQKAVSIGNKGSGVNASIMGQNISAHNLEEKQRKLEEMKSFNLFSSTGKKVSEGISNASRKLINYLTGE